MKIIFAGTPEFAIPALNALHSAGHEILAVLTQPDRPAGRGRQLMASSVAVRANALGLIVHKFIRLDADAQVVLHALGAEIMVVVAYGLLLPQAVLDIPRYGCLNIHGSLLPRWRGAAPIARAVEAGDTETGVTIMRMEAGLDTGPMLLKDRVPITETSTAASVQEALAPMGGRLIVDALARLSRNELPETRQADEGATYAKKLSKEEARMDWSQSAELLARRIRAFNPAPVAWSELDGERIRFWNAMTSPEISSAPVGTVLSSGDGLRVATSDGTVEITELQRPGGRVLAAPDALRNWRILGRRFI